MLVASIFCASFLATLASENRLPVVLSCDTESMGGLEGTALRVHGDLGFAVGVSGTGLALVPESRSRPRIELFASSGIGSGRDGDATIVVWIQAESAPVEFPAVLSNKDWESGEIVDYTSEHDLGRSRDTGVNPGWVIGIQPDGAWFFNIGDGRNRLDYRPTAARQSVCDGEWHQLAVTIARDVNEARLYFDGANVAIYDLSVLGDLTSELPIFVGADGRGGHDGPGELDVALDEVTILPWVFSLDEIRERRRRYRPEVEVAEAPVRRDSLALLAWNIWHGGRHNGEVAGVEHTVEVVRASGVDIVAMQETYGSGPRIADALGFHFYLRSSNLSIMSRYPIVATHPIYRGFFLGGATIEVGPDERVAVFSLWINHLPASWSRDAAVAGATPAELIASEEPTRLREITAILDGLTPAIAGADAVPLVVAGDFNSPSHLDWVEATAERNHGLVVSWPVSGAMADAGFVDAYRAIHPDPVSRPGRTWSPRFGEAKQDRIDYVYYLGSGIEVTAAEMLDRHAVRWPSDHAAVLVRFALGR